GFPKRMVQVVLKGEKPLRGSANAHLKPIAFEKEFEAFIKKFGKKWTEKDFLSYQLYPKVFEDFAAHHEVFGNVGRLPTPLFFYGLNTNEEALIEIDEGKTLLVQ